MTGAIEGRLSKRFGETKLKAVLASLGINTTVSGQRETSYYHLTAIDAKCERQYKQLEEAVKKKDTQQVERVIRSIEKIDRDREFVSSSLPSDCQATRYVVPTPLYFGESSLNLFGIEAEVETVVEFFPAIGCNSEMRILAMAASHETETFLFRLFSLRDVAALDHPELIVYRTRFFGHTFTLRGMT